MSRHDSFLMVLDRYTMEICLTILMGISFGVGLADGNWALLLLSGILAVSLVAECTIRRRLR